MIFKPDRPWQHKVFDIRLLIFPWGLCLPRKAVQNWNFLRGGVAVTFLFLLLCNWILKYSGVENGLRFKNDYGHLAYELMMHDMHTNNWLDSMRLEVMFEYLRA